MLGKCFEAWCAATFTLPGLPEKALLLDLNAAPVAGEYVPQAILLQQLYRSTGSRTDLNQIIHTFFSDPDAPALGHLQEQLSALAFYEKLIHQPAFLSSPQAQADVADMLASPVPALAFLDPFNLSHTGGLRQEQLLAAGVDLVLLLQPQTLLRAMSGKASQSMKDLFGERLTQVRGYFKREKAPCRRVRYTLLVLQEVLAERDYLALKFDINAPNSAEASYYLLLASRQKAVYRSFKEMLLPYSVFQEDGVPLLHTNQQQPDQLALFIEAPKYTVLNLAAELEDKSSLYKYKAIEKIYEEHHIGTTYILLNYVEAFKLLRDRGKIELLNPKTMQSIRAATAASVVKYKTS